MNDRKFVVITWVDSALNLSGWQEIEELIEATKILEVVSAGWIIYEDDVQVVIAPNIATDDSQGSEAIAIPVVCVTDVKEISLLPPNTEPVDNKLRHVL